MCRWKAPWREGEGSRLSITAPWQPLSPKASSRTLLFPTVTTIPEQVESAAALRPASAQELRMLVPRVGPNCWGSRNVINTALAGPSPT